MTTIIDLLQEAEDNLRYPATASVTQLLKARELLHGAIMLLRKDYWIYDNSMGSLMNSLMEQQVAAEQRR